MHRTDYFIPYIRLRSRCADSSTFARYDALLNPATLRSSLVQLKETDKSRIGFQSFTIRVLAFGET
jgi:hypothetical protein